MAGLTILLGCLAHFWRDIRLWFQKNHDMKLIAEPKRAVYKKVLYSMYAMLVNDFRLAGVRAFPVFLELVRAFHLMLALPEVAQIGQVFLNGNAKFRSPTSDERQQNPEVSAVFEFNLKGFVITINHYSKHLDAAPSSSSSSSASSSSSSSSSSASSSAFASSASPAAEEIDESNEEGIVGVGASGPDIQDDQDDDNSAEADAKADEAELLDKEIETIQLDQLFVASDAASLSVGIFKPDALLGAKFKLRFILKVGSQYPLQRIWRFRAPRLLIVAPIFKADIAPSTGEGGGSTSTCAELGFREEKHRLSPEGPKELSDYVPQRIKQIASEAKKALHTETSLFLLPRSKTSIAAQNRQKPLAAGAGAGSGVAAAAAGAGGEMRSDQDSDEDNDGVNEDITAGSMAEQSHDTKVK